MTGIGPGMVLAYALLISGVIVGALWLTLRVSGEGVSQ